MRVCTQLHTVVVAALEDGELLAELSFKADFGEARANQGGDLITTAIVRKNPWRRKAPLRVSYSAS